MTSSLRHSRAPRGFTLMEMLVVMGIILLLISILLPTLNRASREAARTRMGADLQVIGEALEAYKHDFGDYPRPSTNVSGAAVLCWALIAPGDAGDGFGNPAGTDGQTGPGFRVRGTQGTVYGPYLAIDRFKYGIPDNNGNVQTNAGNDDRQNVIADRYNHPILYFVANKGAPVQASGAVAYVDQWNYTAGQPHARYNFSDGASFLNNGNLTVSASSSALSRFEWMLGDSDNNGVCDPTKGETGINLPYLLWSAGPDGRFLCGDPASGGVSATQSNIDAANSSDDVTNFR